MDDDTKLSAHSARPVPRWLRIVAIVAAILMALQGVAFTILGAGIDTGRADRGLRLSYDCTSDRFCRVSDVKPGAAAARADVRPGDMVRLDRYWERHRALDMGDRLGLAIRRAGAERHLTLLLDPLRPRFVTTYVAGGTIGIAVNLIALLLLVRAGRRWPGLLLGLALTAYGLPGNYPRFWQNDPALYVPFLSGLSLWMLATPVLMLLALRAFRADLLGITPRWLDRLIAVIAVVEGMVFLWGMTAELGVAPVLGIADGLSLMSLGTSLGSLLGPIALAAGWRDVPAASRRRYAVMWAAVSVISVYSLIDPLIMLTGNNYTEASWPVVIQIAALLLGATLFAYGLLRHRVIDLGFAINRTLVYSALSFIVLLAFGLIEWGAEKLLPIESHEASVAIDAGITLALFLAFHRIHGWVEHIVERVFFHRWHANEAALADSLRLAAYITDASVLAERAVAELARFTGGAAAAIYRIDAQGPVLTAGHIQGVAARLGIDDAALVAMRADLALVRDGWVAGGLALPMLHRAEVTGLVLIGPKPDGNPYRPDEEGQLAEAARRVGIDLYALRVEELERANLLLTARLTPIAA